MPKRSPEEEWLDEPEGRGEAGPTRSPYEGDIPPWGQPGYSGYFPLAGKVYYITAYVLAPPEGDADPNADPSSPAISIRDVGAYPMDISFGTDAMYQLIGAVPVRNEEKGTANKIVEYLTSIIERTGRFGKILAADSYPWSKSVQLPNGRFMPVHAAQQEWMYFKFVNAYSENRLYGGPEEGGWWYDAGLPVASVPVVATSEEGVLDWMPGEFPNVSVDEMEAYIKDTAGWHSPHPSTSVLGHDTFRLIIQDFIAAPYPYSKPRYE